MKTQTRLRCQFRFPVIGVSTVLVAGSASAQVDVGRPSVIRQLVPAEKLEAAAIQQYGAMLAEARSKGSLAPDQDPQLQRLRAIAARLIPYAAQWNDRANAWRWEINLIASKQINAFCMPGGKIVFYTAILNDLRLTDDETAMVMGHEMAHALREHGRSRMAKTQATNLGLSLGSQLLGLGQLGETAADMGTQLIALQFSRSDETEADLVGLELGARAGYNPNAPITLWEKMTKATNGSSGLSFLSTHPSGPNRSKELKANVPRVQALYDQTRAR